MNAIERVIDKNFVMKNYKDLFKGLGTFDRPYKIVLKENAVPKLRAARRIPHAIVNKLNYMKNHKICVLSRRLSAITNFYECHLVSNQVRKYFK